MFQRVEKLVRDGAEDALPLRGVSQRAVLVSDVLLRCSMPSPFAHGRYPLRNV